jgi:hypothetical protein
MSGNGLKILSLPVGKDACSHYRIKEVFSGINQFGAPHSAGILDKDEMDMTRVPFMLTQADVLYLRPGSEQGLADLEKIMQELTLPVHYKTVYDLDDNLEMIEPYSMFYQDFGVQEVQAEDGTWIWKDGEGGFSLATNRKKQQQVFDMIKRADAVSVTTPILASWARSKGAKKVIITPNSVDTQKWWKGRKIAPKNAPIRMIWQGSPSHYRDWYEIKDVINAVLEERPNVELYMLGSNYGGLWNSDRIFTLPWVAFEAHSYRMMALEPDLAIIPLEDNPFNANKSAIKWLEMSAMGIPSLVSGVSPYKEVITPMTAAIYTDAQSCYDQLHRLLDDASYRKRLGDRAHTYVHTHATLEQTTPILLNTLQKLVG